MSRVEALIHRALEKTNPPVFVTSALIVIAFVAFGVSATDTASAAFATAHTFLVAQLGWLYVLAATAILGGVAYVSLSRHGAIRLGGDDSAPEFSYPVWFSMMMAAGMGIGVVFFGVAEPLQHYAELPGVDPHSERATVEALRVTFFHWGLHPWAIYCALAIPLAYYHFRHELPLAPRSLLYPLIGDRIHGPIGHVVDIVCTVGTLFGVATSLGLGAVQINSGLSQLFGWPETVWMRVFIVVSITAVATISVVTGVKAGIRWLSQLNMSIAALVLVFVLVTGPTLYIIELLISALGRYIQTLPEMSLWVAPAEGSGWQQDWTLFYWAWWLSWSPFVGVFTARISKGRTIREVAAAAFLVPTMLAFLWFATLGGTALHWERHGSGGLGEVAAEHPSASLYALLDKLPWSSVTTVVVTLLIVVFFVTSSDSGSLVDDMVTSGGHPDPPRAQRVFWAVAEGAVACVLLVGGGLTALRSAALTTGLPMAAVLLIALYGLIRALRIDQRSAGKPDVERLTEQ